MTATTNDNPAVKKVPRFKILQDFELLTRETKLQWFY